MNINIDINTNMKINTNILNEYTCSNNNHHLNYVDVYVFFLKLRIAITTNPRPPSPEGWWPEGVGVQTRRCFTRHSEKLQTCTFEGPGASNTTKIPREDPQRERKKTKIVAGDGKKRHLWGPAEGRSRGGEVRLFFFWACFAISCNIQVKNIFGAVLF